MEEYFRIVANENRLALCRRSGIGGGHQRGRFDCDRNTSEISGTRIGTAYQIYDDCLDLAGTESATGKTLGTDLRKGKFTLPVLIFLRSASEFERERCCQLVLEEKIEEMTELLKNGATNGALNESIDAGSDLIRRRKARWIESPQIPMQTRFLPSVTPCAKCSINFASRCRSSRSARCRRESGRAKNLRLAAHRR